MRFCHVSNHYLVTWSSRTTSFLPQSSTSPTMSKQAAFITRCTLGTGGGLYRCVTKLLNDLIYLVLILGVSEVTSTRCDNHSSYNILRQNLTYHVLQQNGIPSLFNYWEHSKRCLPKAITLCPDIGHLPSDNKVCWYPQQDWSPLCPGKLVPHMYAISTGPDQCCWQNWCWNDEQGWDLVLRPHMSGLHQDRKVFVPYLWQHTLLLSNLSPSVKVTVLLFICYCLARWLWSR